MQIPQTDLFRIRDFSFRVRTDSPWDQGIVIEVIRGNPYAALLGELRPGDVCLDIGAHIGAFSVLAASRGAHVYAFEPVPANFALLVENIALNGFEHQITAINQAVWSSSVERHMGIVQDGNTGGGSIHWETGSTIRVNCVGLLEFMERENLERCRGLKLDAEGSEYEILGSLTPEDLQRFDVLSMEYHSVEGHTADALIDHLHVSGFATRRVLYADYHGDLGLLHAMRTQYVLGTMLKRLQQRELEVSVELAESRISRIPVIGSIWNLIRRKAHELVVYYVRKLAKEQGLIGDEMTWVLTALQSRLSDKLPLVDGPEYAKRSNT